jgi:hypothetical protein
MASGNLSKTVQTVCKRSGKWHLTVSPEEYSTVEEFEYRLRHCQRAGSCAEIPQRAAALEAGQNSSDYACRAPNLVTCLSKACSMAIAR